MKEQKKQNLADPNVRKRFVTYKEAAELYSMGMTRIQEHAKMAGATYKIKMGNKVFVNTDIFEAYLEQYRVQGDYEGMADTMGAGIRFDCTWLLKYKNLHTLWLGKVGTSLELKQ